MKKQLLFLPFLMLFTLLAQAQDSAKGLLNVNYMLSWEVASTANTAIYRAEHYGVFVSTTGNQPANFTHLYDEVLSTTIPNWQPQPREIDISQFSNQSIYLAFRHYDVFDMDRVVIDNVKVRRVVAGQPDVVLMFHDFQAGIDHPAGEEWLPEGWTKVDQDADGNNWYFAVRLNNATMRSQSYISGVGGINPNNWLITNQLYLGFVGSEEAQNPSISIFPNPATDVLSFRSNVQLTLIEVYDGSGRKMHQSTPETTDTRLNIASWPQGIYLIRINANGKITAQRFLKR